MQQNNYTWDLSKFCKDIADCEAKIKDLQKSIEYLASFRGKLSDPKALKEYWEKSNVVGTEYEKCLIFAYASKDTDFGQEDMIKLCQAVDRVGVEFASSTAWEGPELKALGNDYLASLKQMPEFADWVLTIDKIMYKNEHTLSEAEEKILAELGNFTGGYNLVFDACYTGDIKYEDAVDSEGNKHKINTGNASSFMLKTDRELRRSASESINNAYKNYANIITQNLVHYFIKNVTLSKICKHNSVLEGYLGGYFLDRKVYDNVIDNANKNLDIQTRYYQCKKKLLKLDTMYNYDMRAPILKVEKEYTFEEGVEIIKKALSVLGADYVSLIDRAVAERWVDVYPNDHKASGGYCWGTYGITHIILMNWTGKLDDVFTLAHELGHAIQHYYNYQSQQKQNTDMPIFLAETASTFNEILLYDYLLKNAKTNEEKIQLLDGQMADINGTVFTQTNMSQFEDYCYTTIEQGGALTLESMQAKWKDCTQKHLQGVVTYTNPNPLNWQNIWHFYNASYYVWQYAMAYLISSKMASDVIQNKPKALENYYTFLANTSKYHTTEFLATLGIDINSEDFYKNSFENFQKTCKQYELAVSAYLKEV